MLFRSKDNPKSGQLSMLLDGTLYVDEGSKEVLHAGNYETYIRNYMNKSILDAVY